MSRVSDIHHINVGIRDRERTSEWYQKVFDAEPIEHPRQLELRLGSSEIHCHLTPEPTYLETNHFAVEIPDWEGMMAHLTAIPSTLPRWPATGSKDYDGHYYAYLRDPDENLIELIHHPDRY